MKYYLYCFFLLITSFVFSQNQKTLSDSEYQKLNDRARLLINSNIDSSFIFANKIETSNNNLHKSFAFGIKSYLFQLKGDTITSNNYYKKSFLLLNKIKSSDKKTKLHANLLNYKGLTEWKRKKYNKALDHYLEGKKISNSINDIIRVIKFNNNISTIYCDVNNYSEAIKIAKESDRLIDKFSFLYEENEFKQSKTTVNYKLGTYYEKAFEFNKKDKSFLKNAEFHYKQVLLFSESNVTNNINAKINLASIYKHQKQYKRAEEIYLSLLRVDKSNINLQEFKFLNANFGELHFFQKKYNEALFCFKKVDSVHSNNNSEDAECYIYSNYYQAKIYNILKDNNKALKHSKIYLEEISKLKKDVNGEVLKVNSRFAKSTLYNEIEKIEQKNRNSVLRTKFLQISIVLLFFLIILFFIWKIKKIKKNDQKSTLLIREYQNLIENNNNFPKEIIKEIPILNIDEQKELEILSKLEDLEKKLTFLKQDFTLQFVAKKIKTNTTYLSYVVNKNHDKTFSEYVNELKINYVINELISNPTYRKYSTQAIAESVGYKHASSFTKSFSKRTGLSPVQFAKKIELSKDSQSDKH